MHNNFMIQISASGVNDVRKSISHLCLMLQITIDNKILSDRLHILFAKIVHFGYRITVGINIPNHSGIAYRLASTVWSAETTKHFFAHIRKQALRRHSTNG